MTLFTENFEGGAAGDLITTSNTSFDFVGDSRDPQPGGGHFFRARPGGSGLCATGFDIGGLYNYFTSFFGWNPPDGEVGIRMKGSWYIDYPEDPTTALATTIVLGGTTYPSFINFRVTALGTNTGEPYRFTMEGTGAIGPTVGDSIHLPINEWFELEVSSFSGGAFSHITVTLTASGSTLFAGTGVAGADDGDWDGLFAANFGTYWASGAPSSGTVPVSIYLDDCLFETAPRYPVISGGYDDTRVRFL